MRAAVFVLSLAVLAHEVCLLRVLAIAEWSHAAALVVSVALLGFGVAGTLLALWPRLRRPGTVAACAALYAIAAPGSLRLARAVDFNVLEVGWDPGQWLGLFLMQAVFLVPFAVAALGVATALALWAHRAGAMYAWNLLGSGAGALLAAPLLALGPPEAVIGGLAIVAAAGAAFLGRRSAFVWASVGILGAVLLGGIGLPMSPFKALQAAPGRQILETRYGPRARVDRASVDGLHHAPGLSLHSTARLPHQDALFVDGHLVAALDRTPATSDYLDDTVGALPFVLRPNPSGVLLLGVGPDLGRATYVVEPNPDVLDLSGAPGVAAAPRGWLRDAVDGFDVILLEMTAPDPVLEDPMLTVEGLRLALGRVGETGVVAVSTRLMTPPRPGLRLLNTAEVVTPHVVAVRSMNRLTVALLRRAPSAAAVERLRGFCHRLGFDIVRPLGARSDDDPFHETATPLLPPGSDYPYDVRPATDVRPYAHRYFKWARLGDLLDADAIPFVQWGFVALLVAFVQIVALGALLLFLPLLVVRAARAPAPLFLSLGAAYMFLEMAFLAGATVRLGSPTLAAAAVIGGFLLGSGFGSLAGERLHRPLGVPALAVGLFALPGLYLMPENALAIGFASAVVAFPMGMPFPAALARLKAPSVPWALAWNGCASVAAAAAAPLLSSTFSIPATAATAAVIYLAVAGAAYRRLEPRS